LFRYFPLKNSSVVQTMQRFLKENYRKNLALKFIRINNVTYLKSANIQNEFVVVSLKFRSFDKSLREMEGFTKGLKFGNITFSHFSEIP
ncbi:MAG: hypothetical protein ACI85O_003429, partial [Saprospiraceae bacterium]